MQGSALRLTLLPPAASSKRSAGISPLPINCRTRMMGFAKAQPILRHSCGRVTTGSIASSCGAASSPRLEGWGHGPGLMVRDGRRGASSPWGLATQRDVYQRIRVRVRYCPCPRRFV